MTGDEHEPQPIVADVFVERGLDVGLRRRRLAGERVVLALEYAVAAQLKARFLAVTISHAPGLSGMPVSGQRSSAVTSAACARSSASSTSVRRELGPLLCNLWQSNPRESVRAQKPGVIEPEHVAFGRGGLGPLRSP